MIEVLQGDACNRNKNDINVKLVYQNEVMICRSDCNWCLYGSWGLCRRCGLAITRSMRQQDLFKQASVYMAENNCPACRASIEMRGPEPDDVPKYLRGLDYEGRCALRPLDIDVGPEIRASHNPGYRQRITMIRYSWHPVSVAARIADIRDDATRERARNANIHLLRNEKS